MLLNGRNAKTNFPAIEIGLKNTTRMLSPAALSEKLRKCCKDTCPSLTCLRLDADSSNIGVWQKRAGERNGSNWVMRIQLDNNNSNHQNKNVIINGENKQQLIDHEVSDNSSVVLSPSESFSTKETINVADDDDDEENKIALQMIEELVNWNYTAPFMI